MKNFTIYETPLGHIYISYERDKITSIKKHKGEPTDKGTRTSLTDTVFKQLQEYISGKRKTFDFPYELQGTEFQLKVWHALCAIPYGETRSYKQIAEAIGKPKAARAVGMANNKNPISIVIPCHRVVGSNGRLVGYAGGLDMKQQLLSLEQNNKLASNL